MSIRVDNAMEWVLFAVSIVFFFAAMFLKRIATRRLEEATNKLRESTDTYKAARHEREEAHRVLSHFVQMVSTKQ